jgi:Phytanoyl-CoA dioxygenase (PhyH)
MANSVSSAQPARQFEVDGFAVVPGVIGDARCDDLATHLSAIHTIRAGSRNLLAQPWCIALAKYLTVDVRLHDLLPSEAIAVQCTIFDKSPQKNWLVALHQDLSIPVAGYIDSPECSGWSEKEASIYVQPPASVLESLVGVRVHIDACPAESGALRVVPGSHTFGRLDSVRAAQLREARGEYVVEAMRGSVMLMRPLLLHASSKATQRAPRRVLHFVFGPPQLPLGLRWRDAV